MTLEAHLRRAATLLLRSAIRIAPRETLDWGQAMLGELNHVEGHWAALMWALGGAGVLAKHALVSIINPGRNRQPAPSGGDFFSREGSMRKVTLVSGGACVVAAVLFFLAPAFRQAFRVSLAQWHDVFHVTSGKQQPELEALARRAEHNHDAEGLAFAAVRLWNARESARLAEEAVRLDPNLVWVYAVVAVRHPELSEIDRWVPKLEQWDPQNALPYFITAESIDIGHVLREEAPSRGGERDPAWRSALAAAFQSGKLDDYLDRLKELDRRVVLRYRFGDPYQVLGGEERYGLPTYTAWDSSRYAKSLLESGEKLEARGDRKGALEKYWAVVRFGRVIESKGGFMMSQRLQDAYKRLGVLSEKEGNNEQAELFRYLAGKIEQTRDQQRRSAREGFSEQNASVSGWNASVVRASGLLMLVSGGLVMICALTVMARSRSRRRSALPARPVAQALGLAAAVGLLVSSAALYVSYRPYAEIFQQLIHTGEGSQVRQLSDFLGRTQVPPGVHGFYQMRDFVFYFWASVTLLGVIGLLLMGMRLFLSRPRASGTA